MPMTVKVGLAKKIGQPDYGSLGASCNIELELDGGLLFHDLDELHAKIRSAYLACRQAVQEELGIHQRQVKHLADSRRPDATGGGDQHASGVSTAKSEEPRPDPADAVSLPTKNRKRAATSSQVRALHTIASRQGFNLVDRLREQFKLYRAEDLSIGEASRLIEDLNRQSSNRDVFGSGGRT